MSAHAGLNLVDGRPRDELSVHDRGLAYGDGLFETFYVQRGRLILADLHWQRLALGLRRLGIPLPVATAEEHLGALLHRVGEATGVAKLIVSRGVGGRGFQPPAQARPCTVASWHELPAGLAAQRETGRALQTCRQRLPRRPWLAGIKHLNCLEYVLAKAELPVDNGVDGLLLDAEGLVTETSAANLFLVRRGALLTPGLEHCGVQGTVRRWVLEAAAPALGLSAGEVALAPADVAEADELFICNSVIGVVPVRRLDHQRWAPGPLTRDLQLQYARLLHG